jgi:hypothetical protein
VTGGKAKVDLLVMTHAVLSFGARDGIYEDILLLENSISSLDDKTTMLGFLTKC